MFSPIDRSVLMDDLSEIPVLTVEKLNLTYTGCTATVKFRLSDNHVLTFKQVMNIDVELKGKVIILPLNEKIRIVNNLEIDNFTYKPTVTGFKSTAQTKDSLSLSWNKAKGAAKYNVYTYNTSTNTYKKVASTSTNKVTLKKLTPGATYRLAVKPVINGKEIGSSSLLTTSTKPEAPTITVKSSAKKAATVSWSKVKGATSYLVYSSDTKTGSFKKLAEVKGTSYTNKKLTSGKTVYFKVVACKTLGKTNFLSAASAVKSVKVK